MFVVEDDAQNGSDHVDAHRTVALAISPYIKRHSVDSTLYSTSSMLRTMELILGLDPMTQFDAAARPMFSSFTAQPDFAPYVHRPARVDLNASNTRRAPMADVSMRLESRGRRPRRRPAVQRNHLEGRQGSRRGHAAAGAGGLCAAEVIPNALLRAVVVVAGAPFTVSPRRIHGGAGVCRSAVCPREAGSASDPGMVSDVDCRRGVFSSVGSSRWSGKGRVRFSLYAEMRATLEFQVGKRHPEAQREGDRLGGGQVDVPFG